MANGSGIGYQLPDELPGDQKFVYRVAEVIYFDRMLALLAGSAQVDPQRFVLSEVAHLYVFTRSYAYYQSCVALQKSSQYSA